MLCTSKVNQPQASQCGDVCIHIQNLETVGQVSVVRSVLVSIWGRISIYQSRWRRSWLNTGERSSASVNLLALTLVRLVQQTRVAQMSLSPQKNALLSGTTPGQLGYKILPVYPEPTKDHPCQMPEPFHRFSYTTAAQGNELLLEARLPAE